MDNKFGNVFVNLDMDMTDRNLMNSAEVVRILLSSDRTVLTVYLRLQEEVPRQTLQSAEEAIREKIFGAKHVRVDLVSVSSSRTDSW